MRYLILLLFSAQAFAHNGKGGFFDKHVPDTRSCEFTLGTDVDWSQPLLQDQTELKTLSEKRSGSRLWLPWRQALVNVAKIDQAVSALPSEKREYFDRIHSAVRSALTKHQLEFAKSRDVSKMDVPRHMKILNEIAAFDESKPEMSLYKIKRAVEGRYSLREYSDCH